MSLCGEVDRSVEPHVFLQSLRGLSNVIRELDSCQSGDQSSKNASHHSKGEIWLSGCRIGGGMRCHVVRTA